MVLLCMNVDEEQRRGLLGFFIHKKGGTGTNASSFTPLFCRKTFRSRPSLKITPLQTLMWGDYVVKPCTEYTYRVTPVFGTAQVINPGLPLEVTLSTEDRQGPKHAIYFNRGVAGSQAYSNKFKNYRKWYPVKHVNGSTQFRPFIKPSDVPNKKAYKWLSRGLEEGLNDFIEQATDDSYSICAAVYEFTYLPVIQKFVDAIERGVNVKIIHHSKKVKSLILKRDAACTTTVQKNDSSSSNQAEVYKGKSVRAQIQDDDVSCAAQEAVNRIGLKNPKHREAFKTMLLKRTQTTKISHNKFIVLLKDDVPFAVWTGSANFTEGGIFGQCNVAHVVRWVLGAQESE